MNSKFSTAISLLVFSVLCLAVAPAAPAQGRIVLDDFENGIGKWATNDNTKTASRSASLIEILPTSGTNLAPGSQGGGLFAFKAAKGSWASASLKVSGASWAKMGARQLTFFLSAGGNPTGVEILLRRVLKPGQDEVFRLPWSVRLDAKNWRKVAIPLSDFKSDRDKAPLPTRLNGVYLLQFVMRGNWEARFFTVDQLQVEGSGRPLAVSTPKPAATPAPAATGSPVTTVNVDFLARQGRLNPGANVTVGGDSGTLLSNRSYRAALRELKPRFVRIDAGQLSELTDTSRPAFDFSRLRSSVAAVRSIGAQPLVVIANPPAWTLDGRGYTSFATQAARAVNERNIGPARYFELATGAGNLSDTAAVAYYNSARAAIKRINSNFRVGGINVSVGRTGTLRAILKGAAGLDFLTVQDFGAMTGRPDDAVLLQAARQGNRLRPVATMLNASRWKNAPLYAVANLNAARTPGANMPSDERTVQMLAAAWWGSYLAGASNVADQIFHNDGSTPEWGLLDDASRAYPAYYAMWLWNTFVPAGSERVRTSASNNDILALGLNTATAHNLFLVNTTAEDRTAQIGIRGFPVLRQARIRIYDDARSLPRMTALPKSPYQTIVLKPYSVAVVQFIEPPKN